MVSNNTVLLVDDDTTFLKLAVRRLEEGDRFDTLTATSGPDAVETLADEDVDAIVSDSVSFSSDGSFLSTVRGEHSDIPLLLYTGCEWEDVAEDALAAGVADYLQKGTAGLDVVEQRLVDLLSDERTSAPSGTDAASFPSTGRPELRSPVDFGPEWETVVRFDPEDLHVGLDVLVAETLAEYLDTDHDALEPLYDSINADALNALFASPDATHQDSPLAVQFRHMDTLISVTNRGEIAVSTSGSPRN